MRKIVVFFFGLVFVAIIGSVLFYLSNSRPVSTDTTLKNFVINPGDGAYIIASRLEKNGYVRNKYVFLVDAYRLGLSSRIQAGLFKLSPSFSTETVVQKLSAGGSHDVWVKILDGQRVAELEIKFDPTLEGYLFPDSYLIPQDYSVAQIQSIIKNNFDKKLAEAKMGSTTNLSDEEVITLASLIEREARTLNSKRMVAGILMNRLKINMPLQLDATLQYVRDTKNKPIKYWSPVSVADKSLASPYNTYQNPGLTPGPICNPGFDAIYAAFHPEESEYLYYITGNDNQMHFATTLEEHNTNIEKYLK